ncbi:uncharacterized protein C9orf43 homolog isoform X1 [Dasypus novemcinctus]|uniref:uncharacterized protein C9orf43 homolog isoform X1 n=1 Tax=Dasypus novemcinctus TaxID=9361 RepID=UPI00265DA814|nr:uncharacterized protein C9orf43 homolog [Dasypus novemcinctus]
MDLQDESQWDETTCNLAVCQHPQCWETIRRIERGHPRILGSCKPPPDTEEKLPVLTIVNISDSCLRAKRRAHGRLTGLTFTKTPSLLSRALKFDSRFQEFRGMKDLPDRGLMINHTDRPPKLSVLNLNETPLPYSQDIRNMVVVWIPEKPEKCVKIPAEMPPIVNSQDRKEKRTKSALKNKSALDPSGKQHKGIKLRTQEVVVPPPSPVHLFEELSQETVPFLAQFDMLPLDLLKDLLSEGEKTMLCPEMKAQLAVVKKYLPLERSRPSSAISTEMFLSIHRLTLQKPGLRYPKHLRKLHYNMKTEGPRKQQWQQRKVKTPTKKQQVKKKAKSDPGSQNPVHQRSVAFICDPLPEANMDSLEIVQEGNRNLPDQESDTKQQQQQMEIKGPTLKQDAVEVPKSDDSENHLDSPIKDSSALAKTEPAEEDISAQVEIVLEAQAGGQEKTPMDLASSKNVINWNPDLKLLRIIQATEDEDEEKQLF